MASTGGGGSSGAISYPGYMEMYHQMWLGSLSDLTYTTCAYGNPYVGSQAVDPVNYVAANDQSISKILSAVDGFVPTTYTPTARDVVRGKIAADPVYILALDGLNDLDSFIAALNHEGDWEDAVSVVNGILEDTQYDDIIAALEEFHNELTSFVAGTFWTNSATTVEAKVDTMFSDAEANADAVAFAQVLEDEVSTRVIPKFQAGMRDINASMSSSFVLGQSILWGMMDRDVAKYLTGLKEKLALAKIDTVRSGIEQVVKLQEMKLSTEGNLIIQKLNTFIKKWELTTTNVTLILGMLEKKIDQLKNRAIINNQFFSSYTESIDKGTTDIVHNQMQKISYLQNACNAWIESNRLAVVMNKEYAAEHLARREGEYLWSLKTFQYEGNMLAAIGSGTAINEPYKASTASTAIGGAFSGAGAGAMIGSAIPGVGTGIGAGIGAVLGGVAGLIK